MFVFIIGEGFGLSLMICGLIRCYKEVEVLFFYFFYVDRDCCGNKLIEKNVF